MFGQLGSFTSGACNNGGLTASSLCFTAGPAAVGGVTVDAAGNLYIADSGMHRVLQYNAPLTTDTVADRVFGQAGSFATGGCNLGGINAGSLCYPADVTVDAGGNLYTADTNNNRVLEYNTPLTTDTIADRVFGQLGSFGTGMCNNGGLSANTLCLFGASSRGAVATDSVGNLYIADYSMNRVLEFDAPLTTDTTADRVFGQSGNFGAGACPAPLASTSCRPSGLAVDALDRLFVVDSGYNRVVVYNDASLTGVLADDVMGQAGNFATGVCNMGLGPPNASTLCFASGPAGSASMAFDAAGNLFVADYGMHRVLQYNTPLTTDFVADRVFGQAGSFVTGICNNGGITASSLCFPTDVAVDAAGNLYVADSFNNRVLQYNSPLTTDLVADRVFGQLGSFASAGCNLGGASASSLCLTAGPAAHGAVGVDSAGNVYIADYGMHRVLEYNTPLTTDTVADRVFGQAGSFVTGGCNLGIPPGWLCFPTDVAFDSADNVYIADAGNSRVLEYDTPITLDTLADEVFGQGGSFATGVCGTGAGGLCLGGLRGSVAVDAGDNVYIADYINNRVLGFDTPLSTNTIADRVYGQVMGQFGTLVCNNGGISRASLCRPDGLAIDAQGVLFVGDSLNNRVFTFGQPLDADGDGCTDAEENGGSHLFGGQRNPYNFWDFFDMNGDRQIDISDASDVLSFFGDAGAANTPGDLRDRFVVDTVGAPWLSIEANDGVDLNDAIFALISFGDDCTALPN